MAAARRARAPRIFDPACAQFTTVRRAIAESPDGFVSGAGPTNDARGVALEIVVALCLTALSNGQ